MCGGKIFKTLRWVSVGKMVWSVSSYSEIVNEFLSPENLFGSQKSGRFGVRLIVARSSFRLAYNDCICANLHKSRIPLKSSLPLQFKMKYFNVSLRYLNHLQNYILFKIKFFVLRIGFGFDVNISTFSELSIILFCFLLALNEF